MKPILGHSFHTPRTSFLLTTRFWKHNSCSGFIFIPGKNLRAPSRALLNSSLGLCPLKYHMKSNHLWKISMVSPCRLPRSYLPAVGDVRGYCVLSNHCHIQILDVSHDLLNGFCVRPSFLFYPLPHLKSPLLLPLRKAWYSGYKKDGPKTRRGQ